MSVIVYAGHVGAGKTICAVSDSITYKKNNWNIYSNQYIKGTFALPVNWYDFRYPENSLLIIDEAQLKYNCRGYSSKERQEVDKKVLSYLTMCRHYGIDILFITQSLQRLDVQIRELSSCIYYFRKTYKLPYYSFKERKFKSFPFFQRGKYFEDSMDLEHYLTSANPDDFGSLCLKFINFKAHTMYDTKSIDQDYIDKPLIKNEDHIKTYWNGYIVL